MSKYLLSIKTDDGSVFDVTTSTLIQGWSYESADEILNIIKGFITQDKSVIKDDEEDGIFLRIGYENSSRIHYIIPSKITSVEKFHDFFD